MSLALAVLALIFLVLILPAFYAAALIILTNIMGDTVFVHVAVCIIFILAFLYSAFTVIRNMSFRQDHDVKDDTDI